LTSSSLITIRPPEGSAAKHLRRIARSCSGVQSCMIMDSSTTSWSAGSSGSARKSPGATAMRSAHVFRLQADGKVSRLRVAVLRLALAIALLYGVIALFTFFWGPWRIEGPLRASASSANKPASVTLFFLLVSILLSRRFHDAIRRGSTETFYVLCAVACWLLSWGPFPRLFGETVLYQAPYAWFVRLPGGESLRAPSRLWMMSVLCLVVFMGLGVARLLGQRTQRAARILTVAAAIGLAADGFTTIRAVVIPPAPLVPPSGKTVLFLPIGQTLTDISATYYSVTQHRCRPSSTASVPTVDHDACCAPLGLIDGFGHCGQSSLGRFALGSCA